MKETYEIALDLLQRRVGPELEWAVDEIKKELASRPRVVWCEECYLAGPKSTAGLMWCEQHDISVADHEYCACGVSRLQKMQEDAELMLAEMSIEDIADEEYHRRKERGEI